MTALADANQVPLGDRPGAGTLALPLVVLAQQGHVFFDSRFDFGELTARIKSSLRRPRLEHVEHLRYADLEIDLETRTVRRGERTVELSTREFDLLATLARRPRRVFTREELLDLVWGEGRDVSPATVESYVSYLRAKIDTGDESRLIHTVRGVGYALRDR